MAYEFNLTLDDMCSLTNTALPTYEEPVTAFDSYNANIIKLQKQYLADKKEYRQIKLYTLFF